MSFQFDFKGLEDAVSGMVETKIKEIMKDKAVSIKLALQDAAKQWKAEAIRSLSVIRPGGAKRNLTDFPYRVSGKLASSVHYRVDVKALKQDTVRIRVTRGLKPVSAEGTDDYGTILDRSGNSYGGFKTRIVKRLDDSIVDILKRIV